MPERLVEPIPRDIEEAIARELISFVPVIGDLFNLVEAVEAFRAGKTGAALIYLVQFLPGPPLPLTHLIAYALGKER
ncbi:MAG: hypothetical protein DRO39_02520 [Thermoprotei archaeon]|nr:MAG: hypothetical protein DRO39_02520 [Thermoprotei archaeon]